MRYLMLLSLLLFVGCVPVWDPPVGKTAADWDRDLYECEKDAAPQHDDILAMQMKKRCMRLKGWQDH